MRFRLHKTPHFVELGAQSTTHLKLIRTPDFHLDLLGIYDRQHRMMHRLQLWLFFSRVANSAGVSSSPASRDRILDPGESAAAGSVADGGSPVPAAALARH